MSSGLPRGLPCKSALGRLATSFATAARARAQQQQTESAKAQQQQTESTAAAADGKRARTPIAPNRLAKYQALQLARRPGKRPSTPSRVPQRGQAPAASRNADTRPPKRPRISGRPQKEASPAASALPASSELDDKLRLAASQLRDAAAKAARAAVWVAGAAKEAIQAAEALAAATHEAMPLLANRKKAEEAAKVVAELAKSLTGTSSSGMDLTMQAQDAMVRAAHLDDHHAGQPLGQPASLQTSPGGQAEAHGLEDARKRVASPAVGGSASPGPVSSRDREALMLGASRRVPPPSAADPQASSAKPEPPPPRNAAPKRHPLKLLSKMTGCQLAEWRSQMSLAQASRTGRKIRDSDVTFVLDAWKFRKNDKRRNVIPDGKDFVNSEMLGLISIRAYRKLCIAKQSVKYPMVTKLLCQYVYDNPPPGLQKGDQFPFSTICINKDYAAKRHRDSNNCGLSIVRALGDFKGGRLKYWPEDPGSRAAPDPNSLDEEKAVTLDVRGRSVALDSTKAHEVEDFEGRRYSLVYFTIPWIDKADPNIISALSEQCGLQVKELGKSEAIWRNVKQPNLKASHARKSAAHERQSSDEAAQV